MEHIAVQQQLDGVTTFDSQAYMVPPGGNTRERNRGRGIFADGWNIAQILVINLVKVI